MRLGLLAASMACAMAVATATPVSAAAPSCILVSGNGLLELVLLDVWEENAELLAGTEFSNALVPAADARPRYSLSAFWGREGRSPRCPPDLHLSPGETTGAFYPATAQLPALIEWDASSFGFGGRRLGPATPEAVAILQRRGIVATAAFELLPPATGSGWRANDRGSDAAPLLIAIGIVLFSLRRRGNS